MSVLITGATGFIGLNLAEALLASGETVILLGRDSSRHPKASAWSKPPGALRILSALEGESLYMKADVRDQARMQTILRQFSPTTIVHGAAITPGLELERDQTVLTSDVNYMGTLSVLEAARHAGTDRLIYLSSGAVYGQSSFAVPILEEESPTPIPENIYAISKYAGERASLRYGQLEMMNTIVARLGTAFGPWEWDTGVRSTLSTIGQVTSHAIRGNVAVLPPVTGCKDWVYSRDVADALVAMIYISKPNYGLYNVSSPMTWCVTDWCDKLADHFAAFTYRTSDDPREANCSYGTGDRSPLSIDRLRNDIGFTPRFDLDSAFTDYLGWLDQVPEFWDDLPG